MIIRLIFESFRFAWQALKENVLRTLLSLLGVTIGIFAIVAVYTIVDSMERSIRNSLDFLGSNVVYVNKWPWFFGDGDFKWWEYFRRPNIKYEHFRYIQENSAENLAVCAMDFEGGVTAKNRNSSFEALIQGITMDYNVISEVPVENGRYFSTTEMDGARNVAIIGDDVKNTLFLENEDPVGKEIKIKGIHFIVIGVQERKGKALVDFGGNPDEKILMPYGTFAKMFQGGNPNIDIVVKAKDEDKNAVGLEGELIGLLRTKRGQKPAQADNFSINHPEAAGKALDGIFSVLGIAGTVIGLFSLLIGGFGIANIMFVSVKERTNIIGIQKSLGAKSYFILFQFLFEAVFLSLLGGIFGIFLVYLLSFLKFESFDIILTSKNVITGCVIASVIGILSGLIPAWSAAKMDPVTAIRSK